MVTTNFQLQVRASYITEVYNSTKLLALLLEFFTLLMFVSSFQHAPKHNPTSITTDTYLA